MGKLNLHAVVAPLKALFGLVAERKLYPVLVYDTILEQNVVMNDPIARYSTLKEAEEHWKLVDSSGRYKFVRLINIPEMVVTARTWNVYVKNRSVNRRTI